MQKYLSFIFLFINLVSASYDINDNLSVDFYLTNEGATINNTNNPYKFSTSFNPEYQLYSVSKLNTCKQICAINNSCRGIFYNILNNYTECFGLSNLGFTSTTNTNSYSYTKVIHHTYNHNDNVIEGFLYNTNDEHEQETIYIDENHNGIYDVGEPFTHPLPNRSFYFYNIVSGTYIIRKVETDGQVILPNIKGLSKTDEDELDGYPGLVLDYFDTGHIHLEGPYGGIIGNEHHHEKVSFDYILEKNNSKFMSFYHSSSITLGFLDDIILDKDGDDIFIETYDTSNIKANISVSYNNINYTYLGEVNTIHDMNSYDISNINYNHPVLFIKLIFFGTGSEPLNILNIYGKNTSIGDPAYGWKITVPFDSYIYFYIDNHYFFGCYFHCYSRLEDYDSRESCYYGCDLQWVQSACDCYNYPHNLSEVPFYGENFNIQNCRDGCRYELLYQYYPNYYVHSDMSGNTKNIIDNYNCNSTNCLDDLVNSCDNDDGCESISYNHHNIAYSYNSNTCQEDSESMFLVKMYNETIPDLEFITSTPTTTMTSTPITTMTSTPITTMTSTPITTMTSTPITTMTSTPITTMTSTPTSTMTSTPTSTMTSTPTSTMTSTPTSTMTSTPTSTMTSTPTSTMSSTPTSTVTSIPINSNHGSIGKKLDSNTLLIVILVIIILAIILGGLFIFYYRKRRSIVPIPRDVNSFDNPVYAPATNQDIPTNMYYDDVNPGIQNTFIEENTNYDHLEPHESFDKSAIVVDESDYIVAETLYSESNLDTSTDL